METKTVPSSEDMINRIIDGKKEAGTPPKKTKLTNDVMNKIINNKKGPSLTPNKMLDLKKTRVLSESESDSSESETDDDINDAEFYTIIKDVINHLIKYDVKNLNKILGKNVSKDIEGFMSGKKTLEELRMNLKRDVKDKLDQVRLDMLLTNINKIINNVRQVINSLRNLDEKDTGEVLRRLHLYDKISDLELNRLLTSEHNINSYANALKGKGIWM